MTEAVWEEARTAKTRSSVAMFGNLKDLTRILAIAERGNVLAAARDLGVTQPALSHALARIERRFGGPLFERYNRGVRPTALGAATAERARRVLREIEDGEAHVTALREGRGGTLTVAAGAVFLQAVLPVALTRFHEEHPDVEATLLPAAGGEALRLLAAGEADLYCGVLGPGALPRDFRREALPVMEAGIAARWDHPLQRRRAGWEDLAEYPWIDTGDGLRRAGDRTALARLLADICGHAGRPVRSVVRAGPAGLYMMETGPYLALLPLGLLERLPGRPLKPVAADIGTSALRAGIVTRRSETPMPALQRFRAAVHEAAG